MGNDALLFLAIVYGAISLFFMIFTVSKAKKESKLTCMTLVRLMWILIFGLVPMMVHYYVYKNGANTVDLVAFDYSDNGIRQFYYAALFSLIGFWGLNIGYVLRFSFEKSQNNYKFHSINDTEDLGYSDRVLSIAAFIMFIIGFFSLLLWTRAFGGVVKILQYAADLRSGNDTGIENRFTVFKRFAPLLQFSNLIYFTLWKKKRNPLLLIFFVVSLIFSVLYLLADAGRAPTVVHFVALIWIYATFNKHGEKKGKPKYILLSVLVLLALSLMHNFDTIYSSITLGTKLELSTDIFDSVRSEFSFTVRNIQAVFLAWDENLFMFKLPIEILSGILGILPSSFRPSWIMNLEKVNTTYWVMGSSRTYYGGKPPDIITTGIYTMNLLGVFLLPLFYGIILRKLDLYFKNHNSTFAKILFAAILYPAVRTVAYANFNGITLNVFYIVLSCLIIGLVNKMVRNNRIETTNL